MINYILRRILFAMRGAARHQPGVLCRHPAPAGRLCDPVPNAADQPVRHGHRPRPRQRQRCTANGMA